MRKIDKNLKKNNINLIKCHAYKPLTFPYRSKQYSETQDQGMDWMDIIKDEYNLKVVTEITEIQLLNRVCETADILQIGSRNMQNLELFERSCTRQIFL